MRRGGAVLALVVATIGGSAPAAYSRWSEIPPGCCPHVRVLSSSGVERSNFFAYDSRFDGGVSVAIGDLNGSALPEVVTGAGPGMEPRVRVFSTSAPLLSEFNAYAPAFRGG